MAGSSLAPRSNVARWHGVETKTRSGIAWVELGGHWSPFRADCVGNSWWTGRAPEPTLRLHPPRVVIEARSQVLRRGDRALARGSGVGQRCERYTRGCRSSRISCPRR